MDMTFRTFWRRLAALVIDTSLLLPIAVAVFATGTQVTTPAILLLLHFVGSLYGVAYSVIFHSWRGQTLGKMVARIRVVDLSSHPIGVKQAMWRDGPSIV